MNLLPVLITGLGAGVATNWRSLIALLFSILDVKYPGIARALGPNTQDAILAAATLYAAVDRFAIAHEKRSKAAVITAQITTTPKAHGSVMGQ